MALPASAPHCDSGGRGLSRESQRLGESSIHGTHIPVLSSGAQEVGKATGLGCDSSLSTQWLRVSAGVQPRRTLVSSPVSLSGLPWG